MDHNTSCHKTETDGYQSKRSAHQFPQPTISSPRPSTSSTSSQDSQDPYIGSHVHPPASDGMDSVGDARRRRAMLKNHPNGGIVDTLQDEKDPRRQRRKKRDQSDDTSTQKHTASFPDDGHSSEFSSTSARDDTDVDHLSSDPGFTDDEEVGLAKKELGERKRKKRKHTQLDERVAGSACVSKQERLSADKSVLKALIMNALLIASWYAFSLSISIYNKWMFSPKYLDFKFPLFTTCMHMLVQFTLASLVLYFIPHLRPRVDSITNPQNHDPIHKDHTQPTKPLMTRMFYLTRIGPCGAATGLDIGLGNMSLKFISLTFFTMCKSSALAFILLFAFIFHLEQPSWKLVLIIATMTIGVIMMVAGETAFDALGFALIISAAFFSGFRWALTQILLLRNPATSNPFSSIFFLAPVMFVTLFIMAAPVEGFGPLAAGLGSLAEKEGAFRGVGILLFPGVLAFLMTASEFALLKRTSVVTLSICGIFKEVVTISAAGIIFHDPLTPINISGLLVTIASIAAYNYIKITKMRKVAEMEVAKSKEGESEATEPMLQAHGGTDGARQRAPSLTSSGPQAAVLGKD